jgi:ribosomal protein L11 methylase PrmA
METKRESVATFLSALRPSRVWDLGANTGVFSRIAADHADHVVALDADQGAVEKHFQTLAGKSSESVLPLCMDLTDPTPPRGWMGRERKGLLERGPADVLLALALIHHLCITGNVPLEMVADGMADMGKHLVIEFVPKNDVQVQRLLRSREDVFTNYTQHRFENCFSQRFEILERRPIAASGRTLYLMSARRVEGAASDEGSAPGSPAGLRR